MILKGKKMLFTQRNTYLVTYKKYLIKARDKKVFHETCQISLQVKTLDT